MALNSQYAAAAYKKFAKPINKMPGRNTAAASISGNIVNDIGKQPDIKKIPPNTGSSNAGNTANLSGSNAADSTANVKNSNVAAGTTNAERRNDTVGTPNVSSSDVPLASELTINGVPLSASMNSNANHTDAPPNKYLESKIATATSEELTLMLYDGAIKFMNSAAENMRSNNVEKSHIANVRAQDIFLELMATLDKKYEISNNLHNIYDFTINSLKQANLKKDPELVEQMLELTRELRSTWFDAMKIARASKKEGSKEVAG